MQRSTAKPTAPSKSALDTVVSTLVRAAIGGDVHSVKDEDLDKYVADLILKESREKSKLFDKVGTRAYLPNTGVPECTLPKTNKRFLLNIVKSTDGHNRALLRQARELANAKLRELRERRERSPRDGEREGRRRGRDFEEERERKRRRESRSVEDIERRRLDEASRNEWDDIGGPSKSRDPSWERRKGRSLSPSDREEDKRFSVPTRPRHADPGPIKFKGRGKIGGSKMDKYFDPSYDPACDVSDAEPDLWGRLPVACVIKQKKDESSKIRTNSRERKKKSKGTKEDEEERKKSKKRRKKTSDRRSKRSDSKESDSSLSSHPSRKAKRRGRRKVYADSGTENSGDGDANRRDSSSPSRYERKSKQRERNRSKEPRMDRKEISQKKWDGVPKLPPACPW